jgi:uncharacterized ferritin-like protein (DUF455 family)
MEARGLDVTPGTKAKLVQAGDHAIAPILDIVMRDVMPLHEKIRFTIIYPCCTLIPLH